MPASVQADFTAETGREQRDAARLIGIFSTAEEFEALRAALSQLPCWAIEHVGSDGIELPRSGRRLAAAIVTDSIERPLERCDALSGQCPTILVTQNAHFEFRVAAARAGVEAVLSKPVDASEVIDWLEYLTGRQKRSFSVLVVDDDCLLAEAYAAALCGAGMDVHVVDTATAALDRLNESLPDLILMDVRMPGVDGIEVARMIRQSRRYLAIPIVFVSGVHEIDVQLEARRFGGDEFITKPVDLQRLVALVRLRAERANVVRSAMERDGLTGLLNHSRFKDRLTHELERSRRTGAEVSLAMLDLDRFKQVNDAHGHLVGDRVLRALSNTLTSGLRRIDIVGRYGGEEFGVIMLDTSPQAAHKAIEKQRQRLNEIEFEGSAGRRFRASFSAGIAGSHTHPALPDLIAAADCALYAAKLDGRNRIVIDAGNDTDRDETR
jgi:diguanylate cyclase (GGDEF)-like protein